MVVYCAHAYVAVRNAIARFVGLLCWWRALLGLAAAPVGPRSCTRCASGIAMFAKEYAAFERAGDGFRTFIYGVCVCALAAPCFLRMSLCDGCVYARDDRYSSGAYR